MKIVAMRFCYLTSIVVVCAISFTSVAQQKTESYYTFMNLDRPLSCELGEALMENMTANLKDAFKDAGILVVIAHLGDQEKLRELNRRRLYNVREFLKDHGVQTERVVVAEGEAVIGFG